jgi:hypothetical protein
VIAEPSAPEPSIVNPQQPSGPYKERRNPLIVPMIIWGLLLALMLMPVVGGFLGAGEWICLDARPWGSLPITPRFTRTVPGTLTSCFGSEVGSPKSDG